MPPRSGGPVPQYLAAGLEEVPEHDRWLSETESERLGRLRFTKRRDEVRLGRWTAKRALATWLRLDPESAGLARLVITNASDGAPEVLLDGRRAPMNISMTDRADWAVCTVMGGGGAIGCDLELVEPRSTAFVADYFTPAERELVAAAPHDHDLLANLIWSAKESALKVLRTGLRRDTRSVEVQVVVTGRHDHWSRLFVTTVEGLTFTGWWRRFGDFLLTCVSGVPTEPPASLCAPSPLITARPSHAWMARPRPVGDAAAKTDQRAMRT